jgi:hypothetical protein
MSDASADDPRDRHIGDIEVAGLYYDRAEDRRSGESQIDAAIRVQNDHAHSCEAVALAVRYVEATSFADDVVTGADVASVITPTELAQTLSDLLADAIWTIASLQGRSGQQVLAELRTNAVQRLTEGDG